MAFKRLFITSVLSFSMLGAANAQADDLEMPSSVLRGGNVTQNQKCVAVGSGFTVRLSTKKGRVTTYRTNNPSEGNGFYIGAPANKPYISSNTTAVANGGYRLVFQPAVTSFSLRLDWLTNQFTPHEVLFNFETEQGPASIDFQPAGNSTNFDGEAITSNARRGKGTLSFSSKKAFKQFSFRHRQHPQNIGFTITNITASTVSARC